MPIDQTLEDELLALQAIYGDEECVVHREQRLVQASADGAMCSVQIPAAI